MKRLNFKLVAVVAMMAVMAIAAGASTIDLTFENIAPYPNNNDVLIENYYNGGTSSIGTSGPNFGISFPDNALLICLNTIGTVCSNTSRGGLGDPNSQRGALFFLTGSSTFLDDPAGFTTGFSFNYTAVNEGGSIQVFSGLDGSGTLLATLNLPTTPSTCDFSLYNASFCPFFPIGVGFAGTAESINFAGTANQIVFDDVTFGSINPNTPEPASLLLLGSACLAVVGGLRKKLKR